MKGTKDFYKSWHDETKELFRDVQNNEDAMTEEEKAADRIRSNEEFEKIWAKAKAAEKHTRFISIPFQRQKFAWLVKMALLYAEDAGVDISVLQRNMPHADAGNVADQIARPGFAAADGDTQFRIKSHNNILLFSVFHRLLYKRTAE